jgi:hypothetical protein
MSGLLKDGLNACLSRCCCCCLAASPTSKRRRQRRRRRDERSRRSRREGAAGTHDAEEEADILLVVPPSGGGAAAGARVARGARVAHGVHGVHGDDANGGDRTWSLGLGDGSGSDGDKDGDGDEYNSLDDDTLWNLWHPASPAAFVDARRELYGDLLDRADLSAARCQALSLSERTRRRVTEYTNFLYSECDFDIFVRVLLRLQHIHGAPTTGGVFVDLGSGCGKMVLAAALAQAFDRCVGVEVLPALHNAAQSLGGVWQDWITTNSAATRREDARPARGRRDSKRSGGGGGSSSVSGAGSSMVVPPHRNTVLEFIRAGIHDEHSLNRRNVQNIHIQGGQGGQPGGGGGYSDYDGDDGDEGYAGEWGREKGGARDGGAGGAGGVGRVGGSASERGDAVWLWCARATVMFVNTTFFDGWLLGHMAHKVACMGHGSHLVIMGKPLPPRELARPMDGNGGNGGNEGNGGRPGFTKRRGWGGGGPWLLLETAPYAMHWGDCVVYSYRKVGDSSADRGRAMAGL